MKEQGEEKEKAGIIGVGWRWDILLPFRTHTPHALHSCGECPYVHLLISLVSPLCFLHNSIFAFLTLNTPLRDNFLVMNGKIWEMNRKENWLILRF